MLLRFTEPFTWRSSRNPGYDSSPATGYISTNRAARLVPGNHCICFVYTNSRTVGSVR
jgi:hypothetical protein